MIRVHVKVRNIAPEQGLANVFRKGPQNKYLRLCRLYGLCCVFSTLNLESKAAVDPAGATLQINLYLESRWRLG